MAMLSVRSLRLRLLLLLLLCASESISTPVAAEANDEAALLAFKVAATNGGYGDPLASWNSSSVGGFCSWEGVKCEVSHRRVVVLSLPSYGLAGTLSPAIVLQPSNAGNFNWRKYTLDSLLQGAHNLQVQLKSRSSCPRYGIDGCSMFLLIFFVQNFSRYSVKGDGVRHPLTLYFTPAKLREVEEAVIFDKLLFSSANTNYQAVLDGAQVGLSCESVNKPLCSLQSGQPSFTGFRDDLPSEGLKFDDTPENLCTPLMCTHEGSVCPHSIVPVHMEIAKPTVGVQSIDLPFQCKAHSVDVQLVTPTPAVQVWEMPPKFDSTPPGDGTQVGYH